MPDPATAQPERKLYRHLLAIRREQIVSRLKGAKAIGAEAIGSSAVVAQWRLGDAVLTLAAISGRACGMERPAGRLIFRNHGRRERVEGWEPLPSRRSPSWSDPWMTLFASLRARPGSRTNGSMRPRRHAVSIESLRAILTALDLPCVTEADIAESRVRLRELASGTRNFFTAMAGSPTPLPGLRAEAAAELFLEDGERQTITLRAQGGITVMPPIETPGYHRLRVADRELTLAVAPPHCITLADIAPGERLWGLGVQLYALRGEHDGGIGDAAALRALVSGAAREGADAIALSPTHSLFAADSAHYGHIPRRTVCSSIRSTLILRRFSGKRASRLRIRRSRASDANFADRLAKSRGGEVCAAAAALG